MNELKFEVMRVLGINVDSRAVIDDAIRVISSDPNITCDQIEKVRKFYQNIMFAETKLSKGWSLQGKRNPGDLEYELPDQMAFGYMSILAGTLMCFLPFGVTQSVGAGLISGGLIMIGQAAAQGERPYYVDPSTGNRFELPKHENYSFPK